MGVAFEFGQVGYHILKLDSFFLSRSLDRVGVLRRMVDRTHRFGGYGLGGLHVVEYADDAV